MMPFVEARGSELADERDCSMKEGSDIQTLAVPIATLGPVVFGAIARNRMLRLSG